MDIDVDQSTPRGDMKREPNGKYIYKLSPTKDDVDKFNRDFDQYKEQRKVEMQKQLDEKLAELNKPVIETPIYNQSVGEILIKTKDVVFDILDDLMQLKFEGILYKNNRLFHIGLLLLLITIIMFIIYMFSSSVNNNIDKKDIRIALTFENVDQPKNI
jgi:uncharacterized protein YeaO (DUF488 family)